MKRTPIGGRKTPMRRTGLRSVPLAGPDAGDRKPKVAKLPPGVPAELRALVIARACGCCDRCGMPITGPHSAHHRSPRGMGGSSAEPHTAANLVLLCGSGTTCCHGWIEQHRTEGYATGFLIRGSVATPETTPILRHGRWWVIPTAEGWDPAEAIAA